MGINLKKIRADFPILKKKLIYFDNACMTLRPKQVVEATNEYYYEFPGCAGRSMHKIAAKVTEEVLKSRKIVQKFIGAKKPEEIIFTRNTTEAINLIANSFKFKKGSKVLISDKEHNSNLIPWQVLEKKGVIKLVIVNSKSDNTLDMDDFEKKIKGVTLVSIVHTSNMDGVTNPVKEIIKLAHKNNSLVMLDAAQSIPHKEVNVKKLDVDFLAFSGHKMLGPSGMGVLYGKKSLLEKLDTFMVGGETVIDSNYHNHKLEKLPERFEAGLQNYAGIIGLAEAIKYLKKVGMKNIETQELILNKALTEGLSQIEGVKILGPLDPKQRAGIVSFNYKNVDPHQIALLMDNSANIMMRSGAHCVHSWFNAHKSKGSARASFYFYNTLEEVDAFINAFKKIVKFFK